MRTFDTYANKQTFCTVCKKIIKKKALIIITYDHKRLYSIKCYYCWKHEHKFNDKL